MSRSCQSAMFSSADDGVAAQDAGQAGDPLARDRVALVRHRGRALLAARERLLGLAHLGALQVADLGREPLERRAEHASVVQQRGVAVARDDLRRGRLDAEPELRATCSSTRGSTLAYVPTAPESLPTRDAVERRRRRSRRAAARRPAEQLQAERGRLGVDAVRAADHRRVAVLDRARLDSGERRSSAGRADRARVAQLQRERGVDHVGRRQAVVEPARRRARPARRSTR